ncbi:polyprenyl synthetase family protein [Streptomyces gilvosporeus]|uniref:Geranylgeranyl diphosphate synthase n=1 Tax=Streptomyces gilvosporeus TaxID=553510 RepID=A0A1V0TJW8_9ACTN|nr:polyprenyl synthetase family protein [Streptomyces gilvosporeus]ARF53231.1 geranylgeranyl diphosphate synthase [Streptomyces gilvosporeus]
MTALSLSTPSIDLASVPTHVDGVLREFLDSKTRIAQATRMPTDLPGTLQGFLDAGGKRLRPMLCVIGWHTGGGQGDLTPIVRTAAALEMFHAFCLIHDDIMDRTPTRRGQPTVHHALADRHPGRLGLDAAWWGISGAILAGDMALAWSDELLHGAGHPPARLTAARRVLEAMREEVIYGQYLDLTAPLGPMDDVAAALRVIRYKTAKYTIERPLHTGAILAGAEPALHEALTAFALPLGEAFQLRDDLLGIYGNPNQTGKPVLDDLREGKHTVLLALAAQRATSVQRRHLHQLVGDPDLAEDGAAHIRDVLDATGARATVENMINNCYGQALTALRNIPCPPAAADALRQVAALATERAS